MIFCAIPPAVPENRDKISAKSVLYSNQTPPSNCFIAAPWHLFSAGGLSHLVKDPIITQRVYASNTGFLNKGLI